MEDDFKICEHCIAENELKREIQERGAVIQECSICHRKGGRALPAGDNRAKRIFRALVRLNYSEWDYNGHVGGDFFQCILFGKNKIFDLPEDASALDFESAFLVLEDNWYPNDHDEISLGGGYWDGYVLRGLRDHLDDSVNSILKRAFEYNYFELEDEVVRLIESIRKDISQELLPGAEYARARIGIKERMRTKSLGFGLGFDVIYKPDRYYLPFSQSEIGRPPISKASEGRLNRARVALLYLASDVNTAVAELRPHPGHLVSTSLFRLTRPLHVADFSTHDIRNFLNDDRLEILRRILSFSAVLNLPVQPEQRELYLLTQLFADCVRQSGFEAIAFRSSLGPGTNLASFATDAFEHIPNSEAVIEVCSLSYELKTKATLRQSYNKNTFEPERDDVLATLFDGLARRI